ncbi:MAG TPA: GIY-YIG nuclease family protein [Allosphingosinicella sp.]
MKPADRKAAIAAYRERKSAAGLYCIRCSANGQQWVGRAPDLATIWNRHSFALRMGSNPHPTLQRAWKEHGSESFAFRELERLDESIGPHAREATLKKRLADWCGELGAEAI